MKDVSPTLLITDDDRAFRETMREVFAPRGFSTHLAADGEEALQIVRQERIHLALFDMQMPRLTGIEAIRQARQLHSDLPCILISGALNPEIRAEAELAEAYSILEKPVRLSVITTIVAKAMSDRYGWAS